MLTSPLVLPPTVPWGPEELSEACRASAGMGWMLSLAVGMAFSPSWSARGLWASPL